MRKREPDVNQNAARIVNETAGEKPPPIPEHIERAWEDWSGRVQKVDERGMALLRAAFLAGAAAATRK
jgi:hypothetical protein